VAKGVVGGDKNCCTIVSRRSRRIAARWTELCDASRFGVSCSMLAIWYGCQVAPEITGIGQTVLDRMYDILQLDYLWGMHRFRPGSVENEDVKNAYGWNTTAGNHETMVQNLVDIVNENPGTPVWQDLDEDFWKQAMACIREPSGKAHITGLDIVTSTCILAALDQMAPISYGRVRPVARDYGGQNWRTERTPLRAEQMGQNGLVTPYEGDDWMGAMFPGGDDLVDEEAEVEDTGGGSGEADE
jgi:hypothetical protein